VRELVERLGVHGHDVDELADGGCSPRAIRQDQALLVGGIIKLHINIKKYQFKKLNINFAIARGY